MKILLNIIYLYILWEFCPLTLFPGTQHTTLCGTIANWLRKFCFFFYVTFFCWCRLMEVKWIFIIFSIKLNWFLFFQIPPDHLSPPTKSKALIYGFLMAEGTIVLWLKQMLYRPKGWWDLLDEDLSFQSLIIGNFQSTVETITNYKLANNNSKLFLCFLMNLNIDCNLI